MRVTRTQIALVASLLFNIVGVPGLVQDAKTWAGWLGVSEPDWYWINYLLVALGGLAFLYAVFPTLQRWKRHIARPKSFSGDASPIAFSATISPASGTAFKPSVWMRLRSFVTLRKRLKGVPVLQRCLDELIAYSGYAFPGEVTPREIAASNALSVHLERACFVLDEQGISHPEFDDRDIVIANYNEWRRFLTKLLARNDAQ